MVKQNPQTVWEKQPHRNFRVYRAVMMREPVMLEVNLERGQV